MHQKYHCIENIPRNRKGVALSAHGSSMRNHTNAKIQDPKEVSH